MSQEIYIGYSPTEFYYYNLHSNGAPFYPTNDECSLLLNDNLNNNISCDDIGFKDNSFNCLKQEICKNEMLAENLNLEYKNNGISQKYNDYKYGYNNYLINSINLVVGIIIIVYLIFRERINNKIFEGIYDGFYSNLYIIIFIIIILIFYYIFTNILPRSNTDFNELNIKSPNINH